MLHPLEQKIVVLQRRVRRSAAVYGLSLAGAVVVVAATVAGVADYVARFEDRGLRIVASLAALAVSLWAAYRFLRPALFTRPSDVDLAGRVERHFPSLQNQLQSAIEFLRQPEDDPAAGSAALRRLAIAQATASAEGIEFDDVLNNRPRNRALGIFVASCVLLAGLAAIGPTSARIAAARFLNPLGDTAWPRATNLAVRGATERVARGSAFQIEVVDRYGARLPADLRIHYRQRADGGITEDNERMRFADGVMVARRENVQQSFEYRIDGGDDRSMPWSGVEVVDPPAIESLSIRAIPPTYTGWPAADSPRQIRTLIGARLQSTGRATKPLRSAELCFEGGRKIAATLCEDGRSFFVGEADAVIEKSGSYWFELIDRDGFRGGNEDRCQINAIADAPPSVAMQQPTANVLVTPQAVVPLRVFAEDDIALRNVVLKFRTSDGGPEQTVTLWTAAGGASRSPSAADWAAGVEDRQTINYRWGLEGLRLKPGSEVTFCVAAGDYRPQSSCSEPRRLIVVTPDELLEKLSSREKLIAAELERALAMQRECRRQVESLRVRLLAATRFEQGDVDQLQAAEHAQQDVGRLITDRSNAVPSHIIALLADFENNRISSTDADRRMRDLLEELGRLEKGRLPVIGRELIAARKTVQTAREEHRAAADSGRRVADALAGARGQQDAVIGALEQWVTQLARWDRYGRFQRELAQLIREQDELRHRTVDAGRRTLAQDLHELRAMDAAELAVAAGGELELARRLDRMLQEMEQAAGELRPSDPVAADMMADALDAARRTAIATAMRTVGEEIGQNQIGQAIAGQKQIAIDLQEMLDLLANRQAEAVRLVKRLRQLEGDLSSLEASQAGLQKRIEDAATQAAATQQAGDARRRELQQLARQQQALREAAERLSRQLERLQSERAAAAAQRAAEQMVGAGNAAAGGEAGEANKLANAARQSLSDARRELADRARQAAAELAFEQLARLDDAIKHLHRQQQGALDESRRLWSLERSQGTLTRAQAAALSDLAQLQHALADDLARLAKQLAAADVFQLALGAAFGEMQEAAASLDRRQTGPQTQEPQQRALRQLTLVVEAIKSELPATAKPEDADAGAGEEQAKRPEMPTNGIPPVAELKLLRLLQVEINVGIERLHEAVGAAGRPTEEQARQFRELSTRQGRLAEIIERALGQGHPRDEDKPAPKRQSDERQKDPRSKSFPAVELTAWSAHPTDEELRRQLGAAAEKEDDNPMSRIAHQMRDAQRRIERADSGDDTQQLQRQIVGDLDRLIEQSRRKQGPCQSGVCQSKPAAQPQKSNKPGGAAQKAGNRPAPGASAKSSANRGARKADTERTRTRMKQLWGELPEHAREQMLQLPDEEFLPKYELMIEDYFRRLAEQQQEARGR